MKYVPIINKDGKIFVRHFELLINISHTNNITHQSGSYIIIRFGRKLDNNNNNNNIITAIMYTDELKPDKGG